MNVPRLAGFHRNWDFRSPRGKPSLLLCAPTICKAVRIGQRARRGHLDYASVQEWKRKMTVLRAKTVPLVSVS